MCAHTRQRMTNNNNKDKKKQNDFDTSENPILLSNATTVALQFKLK